MTSIKSKDLFSMILRVSYFAIFWEMEEKLKEKMLYINILN